MKDPDNWNTGWDRDSSTPYAIKEDRVIVYDNPTSMKIKVSKLSLMQFVIHFCTNDVLG